MNDTSELFLVLIMPKIVILFGEIHFEFNLSKVVKYDIGFQKLQNQLI